MEERDNPHWGWLGSAPILCNELRSGIVGGDPGINIVMAKREVLFQSRDEF